MHSCLRLPILSICFLFNRVLLDQKKWCIDFMGAINKTEKKAQETNNLPLRQSECAMFNTKNMFSTLNVVIARDSESGV